MKRKFISLILILILITLGCAREASAPVRKEIILSGITSTESGKPSWQKEFEITLAEARKEGKLVIYQSWMPPLREAIASGFKAKYGIDIEFVSGRTSELAEKILRERRAGIYNAELFSGGSTTMTITLKPAGILEAIEPVLILPEVKDPAVWWNGRLNFVDKDKLILNFMASLEGGETVINPQFLKREELRSLKDLLNPKWKGKIIMYDPTRPGKAQQATAMIAQAIGWDYWREFVKQMPAITVDQRQIVEWVVKGKYPVGLFYQDVIVQEFINAGAPIEAFSFPEGQYLTGSVGHITFFKNAPNPNARKIFANWLLAKEGQAIFSKVNISQSTRLDVPAEHLPADIIRREGVKYLSAISEEWTLTARIEAAKLQQEIFGPLLK